MEVVEMAKEQISLRIPKEILKRLDEIAELADMDRSRLIVNILDEGSKTLEATKRVGILQFSVLLRNMGDWMDKWAKNMREKKNLDEFIEK
jgi:metal-responsive CopG/Arc/MetJ family transcriptional regulator